MKLLRSRLLFWLASLLLVVGVLLAGRWLGTHSAPGCDLDGLKIEPLYRVRIVDPTGSSHSFCCVRCAQLWLSRRLEKPATIYVTDESSGAEIDSRSATFVASDVITEPVTGNRVHVFRDPEAAAQHARIFRGVLLTGSERP